MPCFDSIFTALLPLKVSKFWKTKLTTDHPNEQTGQGNFLPVPGSHGLSVTPSLGVAHL